MSSTAAAAADFARMSEVSTDELVTFERALEEHRGRLFGIAFSILRDPVDAEDAVQDAAAAAWRGWATRTDPAATTAWLTTICVRTAVRHRRRILRRLRLDMSLREEASRSATHGDLVSEDIDLHRAHGRLSRQQRAVISLHYSYGYTLMECAGLLGCSPGTVATHLSRALARLRKELGDA